ncbi:TPA: hypothetical protein DHW58_02740 [Patescibacteria group bacterium]|uniref:DAGKc domain-containing protein n=2 Tax=Bacteria division Kazan-3B-28 TaxID=1798534 RepID=A0A0G1X6B8_UNCK3|nr:MAG: hypothetical protein VE98_C0001G0344 [candidate division Kazan bacterium GW2011_GWA1_50_15]KKW25381.1 MAG: hypothetical protein VE99_C0001G0018 [candidate division Kazan bacterium GW2011_GWC1_52_13]KKW26688.1 MAG: hypothetical protein VF00_C0002G0013 [candidate division Kazan bacterium GW2011_GWB1_52_7]HAV65898.1 hypothetical protein [Patescibacteria group bacterium]HCL47875.1 hypothetical protein [Patescibacteria group bacterium]
MYLFLINPEAGNRRFARVEQQMHRLLKRYGVKYRFIMIDNLDRVAELIKQNLKSTDHGVVAVGGNATVNAVINALVGEDVPVGIIPMSKTNHLAYSLGLKRLPAAIKALAEHDLRSERLGKIGQHYFVGSVEVAARASLLTQYLRKTNPWLKFLGLAKPVTPEDGTPTLIELDDEVQVKSRAHRLQIQLNGVNNDKKLKLTLFASPNPDTASILHSDAVAIESDIKMPVIIGNETVAHTPVEIKGLTKYVRLIVPKEPRLTATESS